MRFPDVKRHAVKRPADAQLATPDVRTDQSLAVMLQRTPDAS